MKKTCTILLTLLAAACTKEADIDLPEQEEKLVVTCFISPEESMITAVVRTSSPKYAVYNSSGNVDDVRNASVVISGNGLEAVLPYVDSLSCYAVSASSFPVVAGASYALVVQTPDGKTTTARTTVPADTLHIRSLDVVLSFDEGSTNHDLSYTAEAEDIPGQTNFVALYHRAQFVYIDTMYPQYPYMDPGSGQFEDDEKNARSGYNVQGRNSFMGNTEPVPAIVEVWALNCSKEFYLYNRSAQMASYSGYDPFSDPVMVYSNMTNGFGCFGAYRLSTRAVFKE
jgi:hypothetical protein